MPNMKSLSLTVKELWTRLKFFAIESQRDGQDKKLDAPKFHSGGIKI